jgi:AbiV family abortive infection protein
MRGNSHVRFLEGLGGRKAPWPTRRRHEYHMSKSKHRPKKSRHWEQFEGASTADELAAGSNAALRNAQRLLNDAVLLLSQQRNPSAAALAILAIEEAGKLSILDGMAYTPPGKIAERWRAYRSHTAKNARWILPALADSKPRTVEEFASSLHPSSWHQSLLDELKQLAIYTDRLHDGTWSEPTQFVARETAEWLVATAKRLVSNTPVTAAEIALRARFMNALPPNATQEQKKQALAAYFQEARRQGHISLSDEAIQQLLYGVTDMKGAGYGT